MNNFVFNSDPLLYNNCNISRQNLQPDDLKRQLDVMNAQYQSMINNSQQTIKKDYLGEFDNLLKSLDKETIDLLQNNNDFVALNNKIQQRVQNEIMNIVKWNINSDNNIINDITNICSLIENTKKKIEDDNKRNLSDINDYIKNYPDITFNEYKQLKN